MSRRAKQPPQQKVLPIVPARRTFMTRASTRRRRLLFASRWRARGIDLREYVRGIEQAIGRVRG